MQARDSEETAPDAWDSWIALLRHHMDHGTYAPPAKPTGTVWTQVDLAVATGLLDDNGRTAVKRQSISAYLNRKDFPSEDAMRHLARVFFGRTPATEALQTAHAEFVGAWRRAFARRRAAPAPNGDIPPSPRESATIPTPDRCFGRDSDLADLVAALLATGGTAALVLGEGGVGKTTLTREAANRPDIVARFGPRRHEVALATATSAADMQNAIAGALGADPKQGLPGIVARLTPGPALLLLDNLETPWEAEPEAVEALLHALAAVPGLALMASLRGTESPRSPRWRHRCDLSPLAPEAARELFLDIARHIRPDDPDLDPLLAELAGLPLAIELLARQAEPDTSVRRVLAAWRSLGPSLADGRADPAHRHASLARSIEVSLGSPRLGEAGRHLFRLLGALPAGLAPEDEAPLLGEAAPEAVRQLRAVGLARERDGRLDLLPPMRRHAQAKHPPETEERRAWIAHYLALARQGERLGQEGGAPAAARLRPELANLDAAMAGAAAGGLLPQASAAAWGYGQFGYFLGLGGAGLRALAPACRDAGDRRGEARCIERLADIALRRSEHDAARQGYADALPIYRDIGSRLGEANCIKGLADIALARAEHDAARQFYAEARPIYRDIGARLGEANCIFGLAEIARARAEHDAARQFYAEARPIYRDIGDRLGEANCIFGLADIALRRADHDAARQAYAEARPIYRDLGARLGEANCISRLADIALARADYDAARRGYAEARPIYRDVGDVVGEAICLARQGELAAAEGDKAQAKRLIGQAIALYERVGSAGNLAWARGLMRRLGL